MKDKFIKDQQVEFEENREYEFKEIPQTGEDAVKKIKEYVPMYLVAFLNIQGNSGGKLYFGITDDRKISGVMLTRQRRDELRKAVTSQLSQITPSLSPNLYQIEFHHIYNDLDEPIPELYIIEIVISKNQVDDGLYFVSGKDCYVKTDGGKKLLSGLELVSEIKKRYQIQSQAVVQTNIYSFLCFVQSVEPLLYWLKSHVPSSEVHHYFSHLQRFIHSDSSFILNTETYRFKSSIDYILRILESVTARDRESSLEYIRGNLYPVANSFSKYIKSIKAESELDYYCYFFECSVDHLGVINFFYTAKKEFEECFSQLSGNERSLILFIIELMKYFLSNQDSFRYGRNEFSDISQSLTDSFHAVIEPYFKSIGVSLIDPTEGDPFGLKLICRECGCFEYPFEK